VRLVGVSLFETMLQLKVDFDYTLGNLEHGNKLIEGRFWLLKPMIVYRLFMI
jgi:hypothetical protein